MMPRDLVVETLEENSEMESSVWRTRDDEIDHGGERGGIGVYIEISWEPSWVIEVLNNGRRESPEPSQASPSEGRRH